MNMTFREATVQDVPAVVDLLLDDHLGGARELQELGQYEQAFQRMQAEAANHLIVGQHNRRVIATYQLTFIQGLSLRAARRAQIESVRVASDLRGQGIGAAMMEDAIERAKTAGCSLIQLTSNAERDRAQAFYERLGFTPSHVGYKRKLD